MSRAQAIAAAENGAEVKVTVQEASYDGILTLPWDEVLSTLAQGEYADIQGMCKYFGLNAKGARAELERRVTEFIKTKHDDSDVQESPQGRGGRRRSPRPGAAASTVRAEAEKGDKEHKRRADKAMEVDPRLLNAAEMQAKLGASTGASSAVPPSWPPPPALPKFGNQIAAQMFIGTPAPGSRAVPGTPLAEVQARAASLRAALQASAPQPPTVNPGLEGREKELAEAAAREYEPSNKDIMNAITVMQQNMVVRDDIKADVMEALQPVHARLDSVDASANQALNETKELNERLTKQEQSSVIEFDRVGKLETEIEGLKRQLSSGASASAVGRPVSSNDPAFKRISFLGFPSGFSRLQMINEMERASREKFAEYKPAATEIFYKGPRGKKVPTLNGYVEFSAPEVRDAVLQHLGKDPSIIVNGTHVSLKSAKTQNDGHRDYVLAEVARRVTGHASAQGKTVETLKGNDRRVKVNGVLAFQQGSRNSGEIGKYSAPFTDLELP